VLGLCECLLDTPIPRTYSTTSLTHLLFFDKVRPHTTT
jgi:predicted membrane chloride channel (bestrophin family)